MTYYTRACDTDVLIPLFSVISHFKFYILNWACFPLEILAAYECVQNTRHVLTKFSNCFVEFIKSFLCFVAGEFIKTIALRAACGVTMTTAPASLL